ncbi:MAG: hypothetical protein ACJATN_001669, partial [Neolewinella sp.]
QYSPSRKVNIVHAEVQNETLYLMNQLGVK